MQSDNAAGARRAPRVAVVGAGPAGLMAAETLAAAGWAVSVYDAMPSAGRKFLLAGRGGLNLTHSEPAPAFAARFAQHEDTVLPWLAGLDGEAVRAWAHGLGVETFVGSSGRVFPRDMRAAPLLRAWLHRLRAAGVQFHMRHRWTGWEPPESGVPDGPSARAMPPPLRLEGPRGAMTVSADAVVLALGGASWSRLGSDGAWVPLLAAHGVNIAPLRPANCGFEVAGRALSGWTPFFAERFAGKPLKSVAISFPGAGPCAFARRGEFVATATGVEGSLIYAVAAVLRDEIERAGSATFLLDLLPDHSVERVRAEAGHPRGSRSLSAHLKSRLGIEGIKAALLYELLEPASLARPEALAAAIKALPVTVLRTRPIDEAISTAGGVTRAAMDGDSMMLRALPGVFCAGEMLDWEAPTGGYLLTASMASGRAAARGVEAFLRATQAVDTPCGHGRSPTMGA